MSRQAHFPAIRLLVAGICSLILLGGVAFRIFASFGATFGILIPAVLCVFALVILTPVIIHGAWWDRFLALLLAAFPALVLLSIVAFSKAFAR